MFSENVQKTFSKDEVYFISEVIN